VRYGGDEVALVLVGMNRSDAQSLADRVYTDMPADWSIGFSEWRPEEDVYDALARADDEMFRQKSRDVSP
jgi:PleD family two-component response regulator